MITDKRNRWNFYCREILISLLSTAALGVLLLSFDGRAITTYAQENLPTMRTCGSVTRYEALLQENATFRANRAAIQNYLTAFRSVESRTAAARRVTQTIPVVVHVVYNTNEQNISEAQIASQIAALNRDFQLQNSDTSTIPAAFKPSLGNPNIKFELATKDPNGAPTAGVSRTKTAETSFTYQGPKADWIKFTAHGGFDAWPRDNYLNIWVGKLDGVIGYASFPGEPAQTDGVVIHYQAFGTMGTAKAPYNLGRTATHEIGHWLNLSHIWGDKPNCTGSDDVDDTPIQADPNYDHPSFPHKSCAGQPNGDMFMNYMDYVDDSVMVMFTTGQVERMDATLSGPRSTVRGVTAPAIAP